MAYEHRYSQSDLFIERLAPLVPRPLRFTVSERMAADGAVLLPLDEDALEGLVPKLRDEGIESIAVGFLHSYANPSHERRALEILAAALPDVAFSLSSEICPEIREYDRLSTTCANAYVQPLMAGYLTRLRQGLVEDGFVCPLLLMMSSGGVTTVETAIEHSIRLVESGPAGGAILARQIAAECSLARVLSFDMGGTTAKICLIDDFEPQLSRSFEIARMHRFIKGSGFPVRIPVINMVEIGAGGGSIARIDALGQIAVGPGSAGADPGPACYGRGGSEATVTDADLALGKIDVERFASGRVTLDSAASAAALDSSIGRSLGLSSELAAAGIAELVNENMANAARIHAIECGKEVSGRTIIAFGRAAPLHAARLAEKLGVGRVIVPTSAGVGSAVGFLRAPVSYEVVRTLYMDLKAFDPDRVNALVEEMRAEAEPVVRLGAPDGPLRETRTAFMRYRGQGHEIIVDLPVRILKKTDRAHLETGFDEAYRALYGRTIPKLDIEVMSWTLSLASDDGLPEPCGDPGKTTRPAPAYSRMVVDTATGKKVETPIFLRTEIGPGAAIPGPAIIVEDETATVVSSRFDASVNALGYIVMTAKA